MVAYVSKLIRRIIRIIDRVAYGRTYILSNDSRSQLVYLFNKRDEVSLANKKNNCVLSWVAQQIPALFIVLLIKRSPVQYRSRFYRTSMNSAFT